MSETLDFLKTNKVFYMATASQGEPHVRPMGFVMEYQNKLAFCTSNVKDMYAQMKENPNVEMCCVDKDYNTLRLCGKAVFCTSAESQQKALDVMPDLARMYSVNDGKFEIFLLEDAKAECHTMSGEKKTLTI
ncbi:pyridoxamine 5'-phosphate oxidase-related FMN- binding protein [Denitrovibrio acetiphilus DSM 12809]|uniref:Pyridoxamine 5'-phosphate oxidase-related FMN-binding protein n=1 Tax=Denitrovibrio acetiphilus (strain DSM 12809 / NBRC 114555 / N2460) TaxID=522772 RepID=D4H270_DENA2|nr:pyridoxamine 5'-phosphate oxidase family protein [Denitrovibrio acetiphilus]ADD68861.1 pyridoxamine 5'-phosphate oxidase-related FMN- binding protein [Denitrovibrio acetiphilus DSM 12809]